MARIERNKNQIVCDVAGHPLPKLTISYERTMCGKITDGMSLANGEGTAAYVVSFADFELAYLEAKNFRARHPMTADEIKLAGILDGS